MKIYQVGGSVRDKLLGIESSERDWVVIGATPEEMVDRGYSPVGKNFPVFLHPDTREEYALARTEKKTGKGYKGFTFYTSPEITLEEDLYRRDLTINAIAEDENGNLIDPYHGQEDLKQELLRHISPAFAEDPLRVLRVARFAAQLGFKIADDTLQLMKEISQGGELVTLSAERIWIEFEKALEGKYPARFIMALRACNALEILLPEIDCLFGVPQPREHHPEIDTGLHTLMTLNQACRLSDDPQVRFAALVHDLGKGVTPGELLPKHHGHEESGVKLIRKLCKRLKIPNQYRDLAIQASRFHLDCHRVMEMKVETVIGKLEQLDAFRRKDRFEKFLVACEADARGRSGFEDKNYPQADYFRRARELASEINIDTLIKQGFEGEALGKEIKNQRIRVLKENLR